MSRPFVSLPSTILTTWVNSNGSPCSSNLNGPRTLSKLTLLSASRTAARSSLPAFSIASSASGNRVIGLGVIGVGYLAIGLLEFGDEGLRRGNVGGSRAAVVGHVEHAVDGVAAEVDVFRDGDAVAAETRHRHVHLHELLGDQRAFRVSRPFDQRLRRTGFDAAELGGEIEIATRVAFLVDDLDAVFVRAGLEFIKTAAAEIVVHIEERDLRDSWETSRG